MGRMSLVALSLTVISLVSAACRYETIWSGARFSDDGALIVVAAQEPLCGCLKLRNKGTDPLRVTVRLHSQTVGESRLAPGEEGEWRFDWAGAATEDVYEISGTTMRGEDVVLNQHVDMDAMTRWVDCESATCPYGPLLMNIAEVGR